MRVYRIVQPLSLDNCKNVLDFSEACIIIILMSDFLPAVMNQNQFFRTIASKGDYIMYKDVIDFPHQHLFVF